MNRSLAMATALAIAGAFPSVADPLPQGEFLATPLYHDDTVLPRYITLDVSGTQLQLGFAGPIVFDWTACQERQICDYRLVAATSDAEMSNGRLALQDVIIDTEAAIDEPRFGPPHARYTAPVLALMNGADLRETEFGFDLTNGGETLSFFRVAPEDQTALVSYVAAMELSIRQSGGCDLPLLAPLFASEAVTDGQAAFRDALRGMGLSWQAFAEYEALGDLFALAPDDPLQDRARRLQITSGFPQMMSVMTQSDQPFDTRLADFLEAGPMPFEPQDSDHYGDTLPMLVAFYDHLQSGIEISAEALCADPSFGFIAAQGG